VCVSIGALESEAARDTAIVVQPSGARTTERVKGVGGEIKRERERGREERRERERRKREREERKR